MSVVVVVKLQFPLLLDEIGSASSVALRELLSLGHAPVVNARFDELSRIGSPSDGLLTDRSYPVVCSLLGHEERAIVMPFTTPVQLPTNDDSYSFADQNYLSVKWHSNKTPLCWALVAAVAVGLARKQRSEIQDNASFFTNRELQGPDEFCRTLRLTTPQLEVARAAAALYDKMPKSAEVTEWLKSQSSP